MREDPVARGGCCAEPTAMIARRMLEALSLRVLFRPETSYTAAR